MEGLGKVLDIYMFDGNGVFCCAECLYRCSEELEDIVFWDDWIETSFSFEIGYLVS